MEEPHLHDMKNNNNNKHRSKKNKKKHYMTHAYQNNEDKEKEHTQHITLPGRPRLTNQCMMKGRNIERKKTMGMMIMCMYTYAHTTKKDKQA